MESLLVSVEGAPADANVFSLSSFGEYNAYSVPVLSSTGAYSRLSELSLATLVLRLLSRLVRLYSMLVRRLSAGDDEKGTFGRCWSRLDRLDCRRRGGGGGGGKLPVLSPETAR